MFATFIQAFVFIFIAEMGDKSQLLAMMFATKYKLRHVVIGLSVGILLNHILAVVIGTTLSLALSVQEVSLFAGTIFVSFAFFSLRELHGEAVEHQPKKYGPIITIAIAFFIGELGDKTQFATIALSSESLHPLITLTGTVSAMMITSLVGIFIGIRVGKHIPDFYIRLSSSILFFVYGTLKLSDSSIQYWMNDTFFIMFVSVFALFFIVLVGYQVIMHRHAGISPFQSVSEQLRRYHETMLLSLDSICLGPEVCGTCLQNKCLLGYTRGVLRKALLGKKIVLRDVSNMVVKDYDRKKLLEALDLTILILKRHWKEESFDVVHTLRNSLERMVFQDTIQASTFQQYKKQYKVKQKELG